MHVLSSAHPAVQEEVVWLDVTMDETQFVNGVDGKDSLGNVEPSDVL